MYVVDKDVYFSCFLEAARRPLCQRLWLLCQQSGKQADNCHISDQRTPTLPGTSGRFPSCLSSPDGSDSGDACRTKGSPDDVIESVVPCYFRRRLLAYHGVETLGIH